VPESATFVAVGPSPPCVAASLSATFVAVSFLSLAIALTHRHSGYQLPVVSGAHIDVTFGKRFRKCFLAITIALFTLNLFYDLSGLVLCQYFYDSGASIRADTFLSISIVFDADTLPFFFTGE
jgi:hypothetical protein